MYGQRIENMNEVGVWIVLQHHNGTHSQCGKCCKDPLNETLDRLLHSEKLIRPLSSVYDEFTLVSNMLLPI